MHANESQTSEVWRYTHTHTQWGDTHTQSDVTSSDTVGKQTSPIRGQLWWTWTISRLLKIIGLFCKRALKKRLYSAKETDNLICMHDITDVWWAAAHQTSVMSCIQMRLSVSFAEYSLHFRALLQKRPIISSDVRSDVWYDVWRSSDVRSDVSYTHTHTVGKKKQSYKHTARLQKCHSHSHIYIHGYIYIRIPKCAAESVGHLFCVGGGGQGAQGSFADKPWLFWKFCVSCVCTYLMALQKELGLFFAFLGGCDFFDVGWRVVNARVECALS